MDLKKDNSQSFLGQFANCCSGEYTGKIFATLFGIMLVYLIVLLGTMVRNNLATYDHIGQEERRERTISIQGEGKITAAPDIAVTTMGMTATAKTVAEAQAENTKVMNALIAKLKTLDIGGDDIQTTNYNIYPRYDYTEKKGQELTGYEVSQNVKIKIRDLNKASAVLALAGEVGANSVGGLQFTIDDPEVYKAQARELALAKVSAKSKALARALGVGLARVVSYDEFDGGGGPIPLYARAVEGLGGGGPSPDIEPGSLDVVVQVNVTFEIR